MNHDFLKELGLLLHSRHALIFIGTLERDRADGLLRHLADEMKLPYYRWSRTNGLREAHQLAPSRETMNPVHALNEIERLGRPGLYNFQGLGVDLEDVTTATKLREAAAAFRRREGAIIVTGPEGELPPILQPLATHLDLPPPAASEYKELMRGIYRDLKTRMHIQVHLTNDELERLVTNLRGLTLLEAEKVLTKAMVEDGILAAQDISKVIEAKKAIVEREGLLEYYPVESSMTDIAGLEALKNWLGKRRAIITQPERAAEFGLDFPKGILLLGVQGCGKSFSAKAVAMDWGLPLLKMDPSKLYNKYIGESERNFNRAMRTAEKMAPVVLWIDEIEKAFASGGDTDGGVSQRVLGSFLSWLQERNGDVFVVATANDVSKLPPELMRKGRFDEIFFVDLPDQQAREAILKIHLERRDRNPDQFDLAQLAHHTNGFSGAELEGLIVSGLYTAFGNGSDLTTQSLLEEARQTRPLSVTMKEKVQALRTWAAGRAVPADGAAISAES